MSVVPHSNNKIADEMEAMKTMVTYYIYLFRLYLRNRNVFKHTKLLCTTSLFQMTNDNGNANGLYVMLNFSVKITGSIACSKRYISKLYFQIP